LPAHTIFRSRTQIGDQLLIERYEARRPVPSEVSDEVESLASTREQPSTVSEEPAIPIAPQSEGAEPRRSSFAASKNR
jgi:hypothetical protein